MASEPPEMSEAEFVKMVDDAAFSPAAPRSQDFDDFGRGYWDCPGMDSETGPERYAGTGQHPHLVRFESTVAAANLVSSLCKDGLHRPVLDLDFQAECTPTPIQGRTLVLLDRQVGATSHAKLLTVLEECGFLTADYVRMSNACSDCRHRPMLDFAVPVRYVPSTTAGHGHLYIDAPVPWEQYERLLDVLEECDLLETGYVSASVDRKATFVRPPWVKKPEAEPFGPRPDEREASLARAVSGA